MPIYEIKTFPASADNSLDTDQQVIHIKSNRIRQECLFLNAEAENKWRHQYFMYILNEKNEVLPIMHVINQEIGVCKEQLKKVQKILNKDRYVNICANGQLVKAIPNNGEDSSVEFNQLGKYRITYDALFLDGICNSKNCFIYKITPGCPSKGL